HEKKVCFYFHIHQCLCPVVNHVDPQVYKDMTQEVKEFLTGSDKKIVKELEGKMISASDNMEFEQAAEYRDVIKAIGTL
ncbi:excinuclease ABC subunit C, partial [Streptococcus thermophilus]|nr:excinuclease ABC subunit C [Streptococcus thermophilus]